MNAIVSQVNIYQSYSKELDARRIQISEERWKHVLVFRRYLSTKVELERSTMQHTLRRLSDSFFYHEKKRYLTRPNFLISLKENELKLPPSIAKLIYEAFDVLQNNTFDWRTFIFMLHVTSRDIEEDVKIFIKLAYRFRVGLVIDLNEPCNSCIQFQDIGKVFEMILHPNKVQPTLALFDEVWSKNETSSRIDNAGQQMTPFVSYTNFEKVLEEITVLNMVNSDTSVKNAFEQEYFPYTLYKYRRCIRYMSHFVTLSSTKIKSRCLREWQRVSKLQRLMRDFFGKYIERRDHLMKALAYSCLWQQTIMQNAAISIQRIIRTHRANVTILTLRTERSAIILVQTSIRSFIAKCRIHHLRQEREDAALAIQRCIRGTIGRHLACNRLLTAIDVRRLYELEQEGMLRHEEVIRRAIVIQRMYRHKIATRKFSEAVEKKARERIVADAIQTLQVEEEREERIHREQIRVHAQVSLEKYEIERYNESKAAAAKDEVRKLHIRLLEKERYDKQRKETQLEIEMREKKRDAMTNKWIEKESDACNDLEKKCLHCLYSPETPSERKEGKKIRQMIKKRVAKVLERADYRQVQMEYDEANVVAEKEVIQLMINEKRNEIKKDIEKAKVELELALDRKVSNDHNVRKNHDVASAAWKILSAVRLYRARKELKRRCFEAYEKKYSDRYHAYYYRNTKTGEVSWRKPMLLGNLDLLPEKEVTSIYSSLHYNNERN